MYRRSLGDRRSSVSINVDLYFSTAASMVGLKTAEGVRHCVAPVSDAAADPSSVVGVFARAADMSQRSDVLWKV
ncbi:unnamed protein product [Vitrella brassicaformis CCMP3155]|uniref:Uncharacterized protein n=1 Tax=Vitrella brassicaformis (strain CCMP3155) TaxID=1169540 RepID=A0A0G4ER30_VITBC|nr:unnamed protein product [Vitrella brassicaformis CCMP3155]|eukprot:CEL99907.1 unnamed protein product [Vitrella brassicaformis CCMP3155]